MKFIFINKFFLKVAFFAAASSSLLFLGSKVPFNNVAFADEGDSDGSGSSEIVASPEIVASSKAAAPDDSGLVEEIADDEDEGFDTEIEDDEEDDEEEEEEEDEKQVNVEEVKENLSRRNVFLASGDKLYGGVFVFFEAVGRGTNENIAGRGIHTEMAGEYLENLSKLKRRVNEGNQSIRNNNILIRNLVKFLELYADSMERSLKHLDKKKKSRPLNSKETWKYEMLKLFSGKIKELVSDIFCEGKTSDGVSEGKRGLFYKVFDAYNKMNKMVNGDGKKKGKKGNKNEEEKRVVSKKEFDDAVSEFVKLERELNSIYLKFIKSFGEKIKEAYKKKRKNSEIENKKKREKREKREEMKAEEFEGKKNKGKKTKGKKTKGEKFEDKKSNKSNKPKKSKK